MSNPRLDNFKIINERDFPYIKFKEHPYDPDRVEVWGSSDKRYWSLIEVLF